MNFRIIKPTLKEKTDDEKMLEIMKNCLEHKNETYSMEKLLGLCRVSFMSTYSRSFKSKTTIKDLWQKAKKPKAS